MVANSVDNQESAILPNLFEDSTKGESSQGLGLGLSIVRRICEKHRWKISVESTEQQMIMTLQLDSGANHGAKVDIA